MVLVKEKCLKHRAVPGNKAATGVLGDLVSRRRAVKDDLRQNIISTSTHPEIKVVFDLAGDDRRVRPLGGKDEMDSKGPALPGDGGQLALYLADKFFLLLGQTCLVQHFRDLVTGEHIENVVVNAVMDKVMDDAFVEYIADRVMDMQEKESTVLPALRKQLTETETGINNMLNAIQMEIINESTKQRLDELEARKKETELQIIQEEMRHPALSRGDVVWWICCFRTLDMSEAGQAPETH